MNVELVRSICADWERGDYRSSDWAHPDIEWVFADGPSPGQWTGLDGMATAFRQWGAAWEDFRIKAEEFRDLDGERVLVLTRYTGRGKTSGVALDEIGTQGISVFHVQAGKVMRYVVWFDRERAFAELGLTPNADAGA